MGRICLVDVGTKGIGLLPDLQRNKRLFVNSEVLQERVVEPDDVRFRKPTQCNEPLLMLEKLNDGKFADEKIVLRGQERFGKTRVVPQHGRENNIGVDDDLPKSQGLITRKKLFDLLPSALFNITRKLCRIRF